MAVIVSFDESPQKSVNNYQLIDLMTIDEWESMKKHPNYTSGSMRYIIKRTKLGDLNVKQLSELCSILFDGHERMPDGYLPCHALNRLLDRAVARENN